MENNLPNNYPKCPKCQTNYNVIPIKYGEPSDESFSASQKGKVKLGGCKILNQNYHCKSCNYDFE